MYKTESEKKRTLPAEKNSSPNITCLMTEKRAKAASCRTFPAQLRLCL
jgi:hypothetical protein